MSPAERQRRARLRRSRLPEWGEVDVVRAEIQALNWPLLRIQEAIAAMDDGEDRERLLQCCQSIWGLRKRALEALKKAEVAS